jgi:hypothetical protein
MIKSSAMTACYPKPSLHCPMGHGMYASKGLFFVEQVILDADLKRVWISGLISNALRTSPP